MQDNIHISVVMPTYNSASYITRTLETIFSQSKLPDEVLIVDDGSTDGTVEMVEQYLEEHIPLSVSVQIYKQKNQGAGAARNKCLEMASCEWIAFLDSDDIWDSMKLEKMSAKVTECPDYIIYTHDEYSVNETDMENKKYCSMHDGYDENSDLFVQLYRGNLFSTSCMVVNREVVIKAGCFDTTLLSAQDYDLWIRVGMLGKAKFVPEALETYLIRENNISSNVYRRYKCEMRICRKYKDELIRRVGAKEARRLEKKRIFMIHKVEAYLALRAKKLIPCIKIICKLPVEMWK